MKKTFVVLMMLAATAALAQLRENVTVQVVNVPVHVVASDGDPVTGLTRANFELFVNGKAQKIDYFDAIDFATLSPEQKSDPRQRRLYTLVFDITSTMNELQRAQHAALELLDKAPENHTFAVASVGFGPLKMVVPFTRDRLAIRRGIRSLKVSLLGDPLHLGLTTTERGGEAANPTRLEDPRFSINPGDVEWEYEKVISEEIAELGDLATRLGGMEGYKHVVFLSPGFDSAVLSGIVTERRGYGDVRTGPLNSLYGNNQDLHPLRHPPNAALLTDIRYMHQKFAKAGVFLDAIDIGGLRYMQTLYDNESLYALARDTGGTVVDRRNDLARCLELLMDRQRVVYVLGFVPPRTDKDVNTINVKLVGAPRGAHASFRPSYSNTVDPTDSADRLLLADIVTSDIPQNGVTTAANVETAPGSATVEMTIPGPEVLAHAVAGMVGAEAMLYVFNGPTVVTFKTKKVIVDVAKAEGGLSGGAPLRVRETFDLPPGKYAAKVLVRIDGSGALGFARKDFVIE